MSPSTMEFICELSESTSIIDWLLRHKSTDEFNSLISVCKSHTDDLVVLEGMGSLVSLRVSLSNLLYQGPFNDFMSFKETLCSIDLNRENIIAKIRTLKETFLMLTKLFEQKTRSPGVQAVHDLIEIFKNGSYVIEKGNYLNQYTIYCQLGHKSDNYINLEGMLELRHQLLLSETAHEFHQENTLNLFINHLSLLVDIDEYFKLLYSSGYVDRKSTVVTIQVNNAEKQLEDKASELKTNLTRWRKIVEQARSKYEYLNYFKINQLIRISHLLNQCSKHDNTNFEELRSMFQYVFPKIEEREIMFHVESKWQDTANVDIEEYLFKIGEFMDNLFHSRYHTYREAPSVFPDGDAATVFLDKLNTEKFCVLSTNSNFGVFDLILSIYAIQHRFPEPNEVLLCTQFTDLEDIDLILRRWGSSPHLYSKKLVFCIANLEFLPYSIQAKAVNMITNIVSIPQKKRPPLVLISNKNNAQHILSSLSAHVMELKLFDDKSLRRIYESLSEDHSIETLVFTSNTAGAGKTHSILRRIHQRGLAYHRISFHENPLPSQVIRELYQDNRPELGVHLDIGSTTSKSISVILFQLVVLRTIIHENSGYIYVPRNRIAFYLEIANRYAETPFTSVPFARLLPHKYVTVRPTTLDLCKCTIFKNEQQEFYKVGVHPNYELMFVAKFLKAFDEGIFKNIKPSDPEFHPDDMKDLDNETCFSLLYEYSGQHQNPSYALFNNFVRCMYIQFLDSTKFDLLKNFIMEESLQPFKHVFIDFLIRTAVDFSTRSIETISGTCDSIEKYARRFVSMRKWEQTQHPVVIFYHNHESPSSDVSGIDILSLDSSVIDRFIPDNLKYALTMNGISFHFDWLNISQDKALNILRSVAGVYGRLNRIQNNEYDPFKNYVLTIDNVMKLISVLLRLRSNIPVILIGETGSGKTEMLRYMCTLLGTELNRLRVHAALCDNDIIQWLSPLIRKAEQDPDLPIYIFFDEVNTCNTMSLFKEILCDRMANGIPLPHNLKVVAACNPYRLREDEKSEENGLLYKNYQQYSISPDPLNKFIYRVYPIPESMVEYAFDFGSHSPQIEELYIQGILEQNIDLNNLDCKEKFIKSFSLVILESQIFVRKSFQERSAASLRDVRRCVKLFKWFATSIIERENDNSTFQSLLQFHVSNLHFGDIISRALVLALAHCYYCRLSSNRVEYVAKICSVWQQIPAQYLLVDEAYFYQALHSEQSYYTSRLSMNNDIALNESLKENIFMILVSILSKIPIFVIGKSGSSKSLSLEIISSNLNGKTSANEFLRSLPAIEVFNFQCSALTKPQAIEETFIAAKRFQKNVTSNTIVVVLLNEVGLAEQSPFLPLKVLQKELEEPLDVAVVGLSNWRLDASIINRGVFLSKPEPSEEELISTASNLAYNTRLEFSVGSLARAYVEVYKHQDVKDFFGLRDFYALIKYINQKTPRNNLTSHCLDKAIERNFGGLPSQIKSIKSIFFKHVGFNRPQKFPSDSKHNVFDLIKENLQDKKSRFLMLLTKNIAALDILLDKQILSHRSAEIIFGSDFPKDKSHHALSLNIKKIKLCMIHGRTTILVNCHRLYENLYELFNQHYIEYEGKRFVRLGIGSHSRLCSVHPNFRVILIVDQDNAYSRLVPPLLNRFEKQVLSRHNLMTERERILAKDLQEWIHAHFGNSLNEMKTLIGHHNSFFYSLANLITYEYPFEPKHERLLQIGISKLLWLSTAESIAKSQKNTGSNDLLEEYFKEQEHSDVVSFLKFKLSNTLSSIEDGLQQVIITYSPSLAVIEKSWFNNYFPETQIICLHQISSEEQLKNILQIFFTKSPMDSLLIIQCDLLECNIQSIQHSQLVCEGCRASYSKEEDHKHIVYLVHERTNQDDAFYTFDFDTRWSYAFIDDIIPRSKLIPDTYSLLTKPIYQILQQIDLSNIMQNNFHKALSNLVYPHHIDITAVTTRISTASHLLNDSAFVEHLKHKIITIAKENCKHRTLSEWCLDTASESRGIHISGTFRLALNHRLEEITTLLLTHVLGEVDRNDNLQVLSQMSKKHSMKNLWISLWDAQRLGELQATLDNPQVLVKSDGAKPIKARFPFSYHVCKSIHGLKQIFDSSPGEEEQFLEKNIELVVPCGSLINKISLENSLNYLHDYLCFYGYPCTSLDIEQYFSIVSGLFLKIFKVARIENSSIRFSSVQAWYWKHEQQITTFIVILDALPQTVALSFLSEIRRLKYFTLEEITETLLQIIFDFFDPQKFFPHFISWLRKFAQVSIHVEALLTHKMRIQIGMQWKRITLFTVFLQEIAAPLEISINETLTFYDGIRETSFHTLETFNKIIDSLNEIKYSLNSSSQETEQRFLRFFEHYVFDCCLQYNSRAHHIPEPSLIDELIQIIGKNYRSSFANTITVPDSCRYSLIRKLISFPNESVRNRTLIQLKKFITAEIEQRPGYSDNLLSRIFLFCCEDLMNFGGTHNILSILKDIPPDVLKDSKKWNLNSIDQLERVAALRKIISMIVQQIVQQTDCTNSESNLVSSSSLNSLASIQYNNYGMDTELERVNSMSREIFELGAKILSLPDFKFLRLFFIRKVFEQKGLPYLIRTFSKCNLVKKYFPWVTQYLSEISIFEAIPHNILLFQKPGYKQFEKHFRSETMKTYEFHSLLEFLDSQQPQIARSISLTGFFREVYLRHMDNISPQLIRSSTEIASNYSQLQFLKPIEKEMIKALSQNSFNGTVSEKEYDFFHISSQTSISHLIKLNIIIHSASIALLINDQDDFFQSVLENPSIMNEIYMPSMYEDVRLHAPNNLRGQWYKCPNGHIYFVGDCGAPTERSKCPECDCDIGGEDHVSVPNNSQVLENDLSPKGYALNLPEKEYFQDSIRHLSPKSLRVVRLIIHGLLAFGGSVSTKHQQDTLLIMKNATKEFETPISFFLDHFENDWKLLCEILDYNEEKTSILIFNILEHYAKTLHEQQNQYYNNLMKTKNYSFTTSSKRLKQRKFSLGMGLAAASGPLYSMQRTNFDLRSQDSRKAWELRFAICVDEVLSNAEEILAEFYSNWRNYYNDSSENNLNNALSNILAPSVDSQYFNECILPADSVHSPLWIQRTQISYSHFRNQFTLKQENIKHCSFLNFFLQEHDLICTTRYIPDIVRWQNILYSNLNRFIDRDYARNTTVEQFINGLSDSRDRNVYKKAFLGFQKAWNVAWQYITAHGCEPIPSVYKNITMTEKTSLAFSIPDEKDEFICPLALLETLVEKHNEAIHRSHDAIQNFSQHRAQISNEYISSRFLNEYHTISEKAEQGVLYFLMAQSFDRNGAVIYDFKQAQHFIVDKYFAGKPLIKLEIPQFSFLDDNRHPMALKQKIHQTSLPKGVKRLILRELKSHDNISQCVSEIETCISFLQATGGTHIQHLHPSMQDMFLHQYAQEILLMSSNAEILKPLAITRNVQLKHLVDLRDLLENELANNPFVHVLDKYKESLPKHLAKELEHAKPYLENQLLSNILKEFLLTHLTEEHTNSQECLKNVIFYMPISFDWYTEEQFVLGDLSWFSQHFPESILICHTMDVYKLLLKNE